MGKISPPFRPSDNALVWDPNQILEEPPDWSPHLLLDLLSIHLLSCHILLNILKVFPIAYRIKSTASVQGAKSPTFWPLPSSPALFLLLFSLTVSVLWPQWTLHTFAHAVPLLRVASSMPSSELILKNSSLISLCLALRE